MGKGSGRERSKEGTESVRDCVFLIITKKRGQTMWTRGWTYVRRRIYVVVLLEIR